MANENFMWETIFETAKDLMIHTMTDRVKVIANIKTGTVKVFKDGDVLETIEDPQIIEYEKFLLRIAKSAMELDKLTPKE